MYSKRLIHILALSVALLTTSAFADELSDSRNPNDRMGMYVDGNLGYVFSNWSEFTNENHGAFAFLGKTPNKNKKGGLTVGGDIGYQFSLYLGLELGAFYLAEVQGDSLEVSTPYYYAAGKLTLPLYSNLAFIAKLGGAYRVVNYSGSGRAAPYTNGTHNLKALWGAGLQYHINKNFLASVQWLQMLRTVNSTNNSSDSNKQIPGMNQVFIGLGYLFTV